MKDNNHQGQLKIKDLEKLINHLKINVRNYQELPIYIGDDDEINGMHCAWNTEFVPSIDNDTGSWHELINENPSNYELEDHEKALIIY